MGGYRKTLIGIVTLAATIVPALPAHAWYPDVPSSYWAYGSIKYVTVTHKWMAYGPTYFQPEAYVLRKHFARWLYNEFVPPPSPSPTASPSAEPTVAPTASPDATASPDPSVSPSPTPAPPPLPTFSDFSSSDPYYRYVSAVVQLGWMGAPGGKFRPTEAVRKVELDIALVYALGLRQAASGLNRLGTADGYVFKKPAGFGAMAIAEEMRLHFNHPTAQDKRELRPYSPVRRADAAYAMHQAGAAKDSWRIWSMQRYQSITLPAMNAARKAAVEFAFRWVGYPYIYGGEWYAPTPSGYCCGAQAYGGFDCSGFTWWVLKAPSGSWNNTAIRKYDGWSLPQRTSYDMARAAIGSRRITSTSSLLPMDIVLFQSELSSTSYTAIDHAGMYIGSGWMIHSSGGRAGVTISWMGDGWWKDHFKVGRRIM
ncbi:MAG: C40 family peptidase [Actinomycetota bacterium]|nr:NlpC/P60 family protein [Actinomycetota bacterium]